MKDSTNMPIPNLSKSLDVAQLRHIQSVNESPQLRGPDTLVRYMLPTLLRLRSACIRRSELSRLRRDPFYYYLVARTRYYDQAFTQAVSHGVERILNVGCGTDTRAYRFRTLLCEHHVRVLECDQAELIHERQRIVKRWGDAPYVEHLAIELNDGCWPKLEQWLGHRTGPRTLVLMEGVSSYVETGALTQFLQLLGAKLAAGSQMAYDSKLVGVNDDFGRDGRGRRSFRLSSNRSEVVAFHKRWGLHLEHMELSSELCVRLLPDLEASGNPLFAEDALVRLCVAGS
jgi:methyltransferase (TIGR00027 family)